MYHRAGLFLAFICAGGTTISRGDTIANASETSHVEAGTLNPQAEKVSESSVLYALALSKDATGNRAGAIEGLKQVVAMDPAFADAQVKLASLLLANNQADAAYAQLIKAQAAHANPGAVASVMAAVEKARGHGDNARQLAEAALARDSTSTEAMRVLLEIGQHDKDLESAVGRVTEHLAVDKAPVDSYLALVKIYLDITGKEDPQPDGNTVLRALLGIYQVAAKIAPQNMDVLSVLSDTQSQLGQSADALATLQQAEKVDPHNVDVIMRCAALATDAGNKDTQVAEYKKAYAIDPQRVRASLATTYFENQEYDKALAMMKEMLGDTPNDSMLLIRIGVTYESLQKPKDAHEWFEKALHSPAITLEAAMKLAAYFIDEQRTAEAQEAVAVGLKRFPSSPDLHFYNAVQNLGADRNDTALTEYSRARDLAHGDPSSMGVNFYLEGAQILGANNLHDKVDPLLHEGLQRYPDEPNLLNQQAWEWAAQGRNLDQALTAAQKATSLSPDNGSMQDTLGFVYLKRNQAEHALPVLQHAATLTNNDPSVCQHLGDAYLARGRRAEAIATWRLGLKKDPTNRDLSQRIATNETSAQHASLSSVSQ